jgi:NitT/TauT family transport system substrate-binding protein
MISRRDFARTLTAAGTASLIGLRPIASDAEPPPETKRIRLPNRPSLCEAPTYVAEELLRGEGFTDIAYVKKEEKWREYDPEDAVRFYALRLYEGGMIKSSPQKILAQGTDWRFLNELKKELKG